MDEAEKKLLPEHRSPPLGYDPPELPSRSALQRVIIAVAASVALMLGVTIFSGASLSDCLMDHSTDQPAPDTYDRIHASKVFFNIPSPEHLQKHLKYYTSGTHFGGRDTKAAEYTRAFFENCGIKTQVVQYYPWLGFPGHHHVTVFNATTEHVLFKAKMTEDEITSDPATQYRSNLPAFHAYSGSGNVSGALVYANYGEVGDYRALDAAGISVEGKVVLVRYGEIARGIKVQLAEQHGARGVLIYSDPSDDGYGKGKVYPDGPWRPATSIERGSVALTQIYPGDPLTPGYAATKNAPRINPKDAQNLNHIPSLPLSYQDAEPLLRTLAGHGKRANQLGDSWTGGLVSRGVEYWTGPSTLHVNMLNTVQHKQVAIQNVIGTITGTDEEDRAVIIGSHHDAWSAGATDPGSGAAALLEVARGLGELMKLGWKPRRTIILASWDATEHGLVGATEWVEANVDWMRHEVLVYLNVNSAVAGDRFTAAASPLLHDLLYQLARQIPMPHTNTSLYDAWNRQSTDSSTPFIDTIGSGGSSDTAAFQLHAGVASLDMGFRGLAGTHNSNYDSAQWMQRFGDPDMLKHQAVVRLWGMLLIKLADDPIIQLYPTTYAQAILGDLDKLESRIAQILLTTSPRGSAEARKKLRHVRHAQHVLQANALIVEHDIVQLRRVFGAGCQMSGHRRAACVKLRKSINDRSYKIERMLLDPVGLQGRPWYKHTLAAPDRYKGNQALAFPALVEAAEDGQWSRFRDLEKRTADIMYEAAWFLREVNS